MLRIHNTASKRMEDFVPLEAGKVSIYLCGPTVYDGPHLGHGRSVVAFDVIRRYLSYLNYEVYFVSNYTDIDDKMIKRADEEGISVASLAEKIILIYEDLYGRLGVLKPDRQPKATDYIEAMIEIIKGLEEKGLTYALDDGVYFDVSAYEPYGELSGQKLEDLKMGARVEVKSSKRSPQDFVLWKFEKPGEPSWESPWGQGRPGWHIECSAMTLETLGESFDIHGGGLDLVFPHHECEVAQTKGLFGPDSFAKYWMHNGFINVDNEKMSKSLGNFFTLEEIFEKYDPMVVRLMFLQTHYRNPVNFSDVLLDQAKSALDRIHDFVRKLRHIAESPEAELADVGALIERARQEFEKAMDHDFDTSGALGAVFNLVKEGNVMLAAAKISVADADALLSFLAEIDEVLGVLLFEEEAHDVNVEAMIEQRNFARDNKNFELADKIRDELLEKGIVLEDTANGTVWKKS